MSDQTSFSEFSLSYRNTGEHRHEFMELFLETDRKEGMKDGKNGGKKTKDSTKEN